MFADVPRITHCELQNLRSDEAAELWKEHKLGSLDVLDDTLWGGAAAVYEPKIVSPSTERISPGPISGFLFRSGSRVEQPHPSSYNSAARSIPNETAANVIWLEEFEYSKFPGTGGQQKRAQRTYLHSIIQNQKDRLVPPPRSTGPISVSGKRPSGPTSRAHILVTQDLSHAGPISKKTELEHARRSTMAASTPTSPATAGAIKRRRKTITIDSGSSGEDEHQTLPQPTKRIAVARDSFVDSGILNPISPNVGPPSILKTEAGYGHDPQNTNFGSLSSNAITGTSLFVSVKDQLRRAPANVPLKHCRTQEQLFKTSVIECNLKSRAATALSAVSATYTWNQKQHLIRKGRPRDWSIFREDTRKAWDRETNKFAEDGWEIKMMVHIDG